MQYKKSGEETQSQPDRKEAVPNNSFIVSGTQKKIIFLVATDGFCWMPLCIIAFLSFYGYKLSDITYLISACVLLPINSAINPLIYSNYGIAYVFKLLKKATVSRGTLRQRKGRNVQVVHDVLEQRAN